ncbi:MAG: ribonuclease R [Alphaproteobacteria bacterium]|nr:ribonuclease R [Alphaproteobacteria bacterium]
MPRQIKKSTLPTMDEVISYLETQSRPVMKRDLSRAFRIKGDDRVHLKKMIKELKSKGLVHAEGRGKKICLPDALPERLVVEVTGIDSMGDLVARPFEWKSDAPMPQIIITKDKLSPATGVGDVIQVSLQSVGNRIYHAATLRRVTVGDNQMVGVYENGKVYSVDRRITQGFTLIGHPQNITLKNRDLILADIPPIRVNNPQAHFIRKIGTADEAYAATLISIYLHHLPVAFTELAEKQALKLTVPSLDKARIDLRSIPFVTIDGADARDFDDAVWAEPDPDSQNKGGFHIMIGIADVCYYVRPETALDADARLRGNSVYFPDRVLPMLPMALSNGVCSLKPDEDRAALVCEVWINKNGNKIKHQFHRALIQSVRRLTYDEVQSALDKKTPIKGLENEVSSLFAAYLALKKNRDRRGVLEIDVPERQVLLNKKGHVTGIHLRETTDSTRLIEELMILANVSAAETLEEKGAPVMYRVHDRPSFEKSANLTECLSALGKKVSLPDDPAAKDFNQILQKAEDTPLQKTINELVLRSQSQACYSPENIGHFGLALTRYAHFTSPIRRYADILVHRALVKALKLGEGALTDSEADTFEDIAHHISATERQAASAEMDALDRYMALYFADKVGQKFKGRISSVTSFGLFVSVEPSGAEGLVPISTLSGDYYEYDSAHQSLIGRSTGKTFTLGQSVTCILKESVPVTGGLKFQIIATHKLGISGND